MKKEKKKRLERLARRREQRHGERAHAVYGTISVTSRGFGFVAPQKEEGQDAAAQQDIFIPPSGLGGAMTGDKVKVVLRRDGDNDERGPVGKVVEVLERARENIVGEVLPGNVVRPINKSIPYDIPIDGRLRGAKRGDWVRLKLIHDPDDQSTKGAVISTIGKAGSIKVDLDAVCAEFDLAPPYSEADEAEADALKPRNIEREDLKPLLTVTIDPVDAKDFDDAVSVFPGKDDATLTIGVHIADNAAYLAPGSKFDREAYRRGFTAYLPGRTLPMLPKGLTAKLSLQAGAESVAHTVLFQVEKATGRIVESRRCHSVIKVDHRLNYDEVQQFMDSGRKPDDWSRELADCLRQLHDITGKMRQYRMASEEFIDLALPEIRVICDENADTISGLARKIQRDSEFLVEECMLAANSAVGKELQERGIAGLYRVHPEPDPEKLEEFITNVAANFGLHPGDLTNRHNCRRFLESLPDDPRKPVILSMFLRSLPRAYYLEKPELHFGLGKTHYCHFTSPIRRYPDLLVHQQLWNFDSRQRPKSADKLAVIAAECSAREENNDDAFFAASDRLKLRYLAEQLENSGENFYEGVIARINANGLLADIPEIGIYGFIPRENLGQNFRRRSDGRFRNDRGNVEYKVGDYVYLRLAQIDPVRGNAEFKPVSR